MDASLPVQAICTALHCNSTLLCTREIAEVFGSECTACTSSIRWHEAMRAQSRRPSKAWRMTTRSSAWSRITDTAANVGPHRSANICRSTAISAPEHAHAWLRQLTALESRFTICVSLTATGMIKRLLLWEGHRHFISSCRANKVPWMQNLLDMRHRVARTIAGSKVAAWPARLLCQVGPKHSRHNGRVSRRSRRGSLLLVGGDADLILTDGRIQIAQECMRQVLPPVDASVVTDEFLTRHLFLHLCKSNHTVLNVPHSHYLSTKSGLRKDANAPLRSLTTNEFMGLGLTRKLEKVWV